MTSIRKAAFTSALLGALVALFAIGPGFLLAEPVPGSPGGGGRVTSTMLETGAVTTTAILDGTVVCGDTNNGATTNGVACEGGTLVWTGDHTFNGGVTLGDGGDNIAISDAQWSISGAGLFSAATTYTCTGACTYDAGGANAITIGSADVTALTVTTDSTGTAEVVLPAGSIDSTEILDATVAAGDLATSALTTANVAGLANTASTLRARIVQKMTFSLVAADFGANDDIILTVPAGHNILITDATYTGATAEGGAATVTLYDTANGGGTAVTSALNMNDTAGNIQRTTKVVQSAAAFAAAASIYAHCSTNPGTAVGLLTIEYVHTN